MVIPQTGETNSYEPSMTEAYRPRAKYVIGPDGSPLTVADLPPTSTRRWVIRRKAEVVAAVRGGLLSLEEACSRYTLTVDEFLSWQFSIDQHGLAGSDQFRGLGSGHLGRVGGDQVEGESDEGSEGEQGLFHSGKKE